ncbi:hypothetical protein JTB14_007170 [Gonioctena quinquepunctata]|nr:hypothetical protein JTB14_007170 [Gonioctena quinquepunctata]
MPRSYKRKIGKARWTEGDLREALSYIEKGGKTGTQQDDLEFRIFTDEDFPPADTVLGTRQLSNIDNDMKYDNSQENVAINDTDHNDGKNDIDGYLEPLSLVEKLHQVRTTASRPKISISIPDDLQQGTSQCHKNEI